LPEPLAVTNYFQRKAVIWIQQDGSVENHVRRLGKNGLADEFRADGGFGEVCELVHEWGELQARSHIVKSIENFVGDQFNTPLFGEMDIVIGAMALACGFTTLGEKLVTVGVVSAVAAGIIAAILAASRE
jgi:hypothetical protein